MEKLIDKPSQKRYFILVLIFLLGLAVSGLYSQKAFADTIYTYDKLGRLVKVEYKNDMGTKYFYDAAGNRIATVKKHKNKLPDQPPKPTNILFMPAGGMSIMIF